ncbi:MAG TPA: GreA/GreB family elongation factor [Allosphingosinicella sp.]|nr:GreA/GreB family elongation factor [Allosphingosinicella sp.]
MSRAFVREDSDAPPAPPLERAVSSAPNRVTPRGARLIDEAIAALEAQLGADPGDEAAASIRRDLRYWSARRATAQLVQPDRAAAAAGFGVRVLFRRAGRRSAVNIVGEDEADPAEGRIAWTSPLARALDGAGAGETVELVAGGRAEPVEILAVEPIGGD